MKQYTHLQYYGGSELGGSELGGSETYKKSKILIEAKVYFLNIII